MSRKSWQETLFVTHKINITLPSHTHSFKIVPFGDVHRFSPHCDVDRWKSFLERCKKEDDESTRYITLGDLDDMVSASERASIEGKLHESSDSTLDNLALSQTTKLLGEMDFMKGRILGMVEGNHYWKFLSGDLQGKTNTQYIAERLGAKFLGGLAVVRLAVGFKNTNKRCAVDLILAHGRAGGKLAGTSINQVSDLKNIFPMADIYITGHDHKRGAWPDTAMGIQSGKNGLSIKQKRQWLIRSGSFLRAFVDGQSTYAVGRLYKPTELGTVKIDVSFHNHKENGQERLSPDIHVWS